MVTVNIREGESIDSALRRFKKQCERDGIIQEIKRREFYKSPSVLRKEKLAESKRRAKRYRMMKSG
jgi:small subunit ribosomal protein S21